jgi:hypothetical protein
MDVRQRRGVNAPDNDGIADCRLAKHHGRRTTAIRIPSIRFTDGGDLVASQQHGEELSKRGRLAEHENTDDEGKAVSILRTFIALILPLTRLPSNEYYYTITSVRAPLIADVATSSSRYLHCAT